MKPFKLHEFFLAFTATIGLVFSTLAVAAENSPDTTAPPLAYGVPQILQLAQAKLGDDTIIAYIHNSGNSYGLNADQIIYLKQQGISENVLVAMLNQPRPAAAPAPTAVQPAYPNAAQTPAAYAPPAAYDQSVPSPTVYVMPNSQPYYYTSTYYSQPYFYASYYPYYYYPNCGHNSSCGHYYCGHPCSTGSFAVGFNGGFHGVAFAGGFHGGTTFHGNVGHMGGGIAFHSGGMMMHR